MKQERKEQIKNKVLGLLTEQSITYLPIDLDQIMASLSIKAVAVSLVRQRGVVVPEGIDGFTVIRGGDRAQYLLVYRDDISFERLRWTLAHELGHILLGHLRSGRRAAGHGRQEEEANYFAKELLMPLPVLARLDARSAAAISRLCGVSREAAQIRVRDFERYDWYRLKHGDTETDQRFLACFMPMYCQEAKRGGTGGAACC